MTAKAHNKQNHGLHKAMRKRDAQNRLDATVPRRAMLVPGFITMFKRMGYPKNKVDEMAKEAAKLAVVLPMARTKFARRIERRETRWRA